ncbi:hypothetical protein T02_11466 [Trichinella nativa]|uniref:Uncharacterized protein n=1 Tax=Trichinella nativa TaxID=6335 RepID=A0A0V1L7L2_9BILA|nr:hypothetical protein T02_11466 [Trichinella nativa]
MLIRGAVDVVNTLMTCVENFQITYKALRNDVSSWGRFSTPTCENNESNKKAWPILVKWKIKSLK